MTTNLWSSSETPLRLVLVLQYLTNLSFMALSNLVRRYDRSFVVHFLKPVLKPDFHSRFSLVASEIFRMGRAHSNETNRTGRKISFALFAFGVQIFQLLRNFFTAKPIRLLSLVTWTFHEDKKIFIKWPPHSFMRPKRKKDLSIFLKQELSSLILVFACDNFLLQL